MSKKKVIIIGSGMGGLTCGVILAKNGYDVTVLEQGLQLGGCLQCFSRHGARFETGMHFIGSAADGQTLDMLLQYLEVKKDIQLSPLDADGYEVIALNGRRYRFAQGRDAFIRQMTEYFPHQYENLVHYFDLVEKVAGASTLHSLKYAESDAAINTEYLMRSINEVIDSIITDPELAKVLVGSLPLYAAEKDKTPFSTHAFIMDFYNQSAFRVVGGSDAIAHSLARSIKEMGGQVLTDKRACRIRCNETQATGVETADECFFPADYVVSTVHPARLLELLDTKLIRPAFRSRLSNIPNTTGCFTLYVKFKENTMPYMNTNFYGYHSSSPWDCDQHDYLYMHHCHRDKARFAKSGVVLSYMKMDEVARWQGTCVGHRGADYEAFKHEHAEQLIQDVERHHPGFTAAIDTYYTSTPLTYLDYTGTENGSMYGVAKDIHLGPAGRVPYRTKVPNLFLAGQNVNSHGMMGVLVGTIVTCSELLKQSNREITNLFNG